MIVTHPGFDPIAFAFGPFTLGGVTLGPFAVRWYGIMYLVAFAMLLVLGKKRARESMLTGWRAIDVDDMLYFGVFGTIIGGRLGYVLFYKPLYYVAHPLEIVADAGSVHRAAPTSSSSRRMPEASPARAPVSSTSRRARRVDGCTRLVGPACVAAQNRRTSS